MKQGVVANERQMSEQHATRVGGYKGIKTFHSTELHESTALISYSQVSLLDGLNLR